MAPILTLGSLSVSSYRLLRVTGVLVFLVVLAIRLRRGRWPLTGWDLLVGAPFLQLGLLVGASVEVALPPLAETLFERTPLPPGWWGGQRALGALAGGALAGYLVCRARRLPVGRSFDLFAVPAPLGIAVARIGCLLQGCCYGREATAWPAMLLPDVHGVWASRYPTQLADILADLLILVILLVIERFFPPQGRAVETPLSPPAGEREGPGVRGGRMPGFLFLLFVILYYGQRFLFEFWRADAPPLAGPFSWTHLYAAGAVALAGWTLARRARQVPARQGLST